MRWFVHFCRYLTICLGALPLHPKAAEGCPSSRPGNGADISQAVFLVSVHDGFFLLKKESISLCML